MEIKYNNFPLANEEKVILEKKIKDIFFNLYQQNMLEAILKPDKYGNFKIEMIFKKRTIIIDDNITKVESYFLNNTTSE